MLVNIRKNKYSKFEIGRDRYNPQSISIDKKYIRLFLDGTTEELIGLHLDNCKSNKNFCEHGYPQYLDIIQSLIGIYNGKSKKRRKIP